MEYGGFMKWNTQIMEKIDECIASNLVIEAEEVETDEE